MGQVATSFSCAAFVFLGCVGADQGLRFGSRLSSAVKAVSALDEHLIALLAYTDLLAAQGHRVPSREIRRSLMHAITVLRVLHEELKCIALVDRLAGLGGSC